MLLNNAIQIISNGRLALGDLALDIAKNQQRGLNATDEQKELRRRLVLTYGILKVLDSIVVINANDQIEFILGDYSSEKINRMLLFLKGISKQNNLPVVSKILNPIVESIGSGIPGPPGPGGATAYLYIGYADDASGTGYSTSATGKEFIAVRNSTTVISPVNAGTFATLWRQFVGNNGDPGAAGAAGQNVYIYEAYADAIDGTGFTTTFSTTKKFKATRTSTAVLTPVIGDFAGLWAKYIGDNGAAGANGTNGRTIISGSGVPASPLGADGDFYRDIDNSNFYGPKTLGNWGTPLDLKGDPGDPGADGAAGADGNDGANSYTYFAYADSSDGTGFTLTYSPTKAWIAILPTTTEIPSPVVGDFAGLFRKYIGVGGDVYSTFSTTNLTIGTGNQFLNVEKDLAYTTGQRAVIALNGDPSNRMEGVVVNYDGPTGQLTVLVDFIVGSGSYSVWDVNLVGAPTGIASQNAYYATLATDQGSGGTPQALSTTPAKITQFDTALAQSVGMSASVANDTITADNNGAYAFDFNATVSGTASSDQMFQLYVNGAAFANSIARVLFDGSGNPQNVSIHAIIQDVQQADVFEIRAVAAAATPNLLVQQGRFNLYSIGYVTTEQYKSFENADVDTGTETVDNFVASLGNAAKFEYMIRKGVNFRSGVIFAAWDGTNQPVQNETGTVDLGNTDDIELNVDFSGGDIRLRATAASDNWIVRGKRTIIG